MKIIITENQVKKLASELSETRFIDIHNDVKKMQDDDTIIVYHGFSSYSFKQALLIAKYGLSGQERANRIYSYEYNNNPNGLFVTINFNVAKKEFAKSGIIMEFATKIRNLEAPVWPGGRSYYVQGEFTQSFKDDKEREEQRVKNREKYKNSPHPAINQSDRPELAWSLYKDPESQALFIGNLNPNMIRAFWVNERLITDRRTGGEWIRLSRKEFLKKYYNEEYFKNDEELFKRQNKIFMPDDNFDIIKFKNYLSERDYDYSEFIEYYIKNWDNYVINMYFYPKQINQLKKIYGVE
ncbi:MAG: hypothetical protein BWX59_01977 [Bacteroidetes bacterium ADurb.Bin028]|jgi:hypothetical protein|nr:MAG: hypothetical protein BWX59_01977 [Bacteroidetes bacterium ADurb.Bin028]